jgi:hypothetical protein
MSPALAGTLVDAALAPGAVGNGTVAFERALDDSPLASVQAREIAWLKRGPSLRRAS